MSRLNEQLPADMGQLPLSQQVNVLLALAPTLEQKLNLYGDVGQYRAADALLEVLRFMSLINPKQVLTPSVRVDKAWHQFILHTQLYSDYCTKCYDKYLHHTPSDDRLTNQRQFDCCIASYQQKYGTPSSWFWGAHWQVAIDGDCSACES